MVGLFGCEKNDLDPISLQIRVLVARILLDFVGTCCAVPAQIRPRTPSEYIRR